MASRARALYEVTYRGQGTCFLSIIPENLYFADRGVRSMQHSIAIAFFKELGFERTPSWSWSLFTFVDTGEGGAPPRHAKDADIARYGCTCVQADCASCQMGLHDSCTYYCQFGQYM